MYSLSHDTAFERSCIQSPTAQPPAEVVCECVCIKLFFFILGYDCYDQLALYSQLWLSLVKTKLCTYFDCITVLETRMSQASVNGGLKRTVYMRC